CAAVAGGVGEYSAVFDSPVLAWRDSSFFEHCTSVSGRASDSASSARTYFMSGPPGIPFPARSFGSKKRRARRHEVTSRIDSRRVLTRGERLHATDELAKFFDAFRLTHHDELRPREERMIG